MKYLYKIFFVAFILSFSINIFSQTNDDSKAVQFIKLLINESEELKNYVDKEELSESQRLVITYKNIKYKFLIGKDIPAALRLKLRSGETKYDYKIADLGNNYSLLELSSDDKTFYQKYYFLNGYLISAEKYFSRNWKILESKYFIIHYPDERLTNSFAIKQLDNAVDLNSLMLGISTIEISRNKIHYFLCKDQDEIEQLTGYKSRGMCDLAYDYIISTYNYHVHELIHLMFNLKLKEAPLYTHPLLQEGIAVLLGGRGGVLWPVILNSGYFLLNSEFINLEDYFSRNNFIKEDASISYSVSGCYNYYLLSKLDIEKYCRLYLEYSSSIPDFNNDLIFKPPIQINDWKLFLQNQLIVWKQFNHIEPLNAYKDDKIIFEDNNLEISEDDSSYNVLANCDLLFSDTIITDNYISNKFKEIYPEKDYNGEHYLITVKKDEVSFYDLFTNTLEAQYATGFDINNRQLKDINGKYLFGIKKTFFESKLKGTTVKPLKK